MTFEGTLFNPLYLKSNFCSYFDAHLFIFNFFISIMKLGSWCTYHFGPAYFIWYCEFVVWHWLIIYTLHFQCAKLIQPILSWWICCCIAFSFLLLQMRLWRTSLYINVWMHQWLFPWCEVLCYIWNCLVQECIFFPRLLVIFSLHHLIFWMADK